MAYTEEELAIVDRVFDEFAPQRNAITSARASNPEKWFDYQDQLNALDAQVKSAYEKAIEEYRAGNTSNQTNFTSIDDQFNAPAEEKDDLDQLLEDTEKLISPSSTSQREDKPSFKIYSDLLKEGLDEVAKNYWYGDGSEYKDYIAALPHGEQGPAQGPNTPVRRDGDMFVPRDFAPPPYRITPGMNYERRVEGPRGENISEIAAAKEAPQSKNTNYSVATASSASDEQRQQQTFQSEYDPQKAKTAVSAAKSYKTGSATEDPFRSQAAFG